MLLGLTPNNFQVILHIDCLLFDFLNHIYILRLIVCTRLSIQYKIQLLMSISHSCRSFDNIYHFEVKNQYYTECKHLQGSPLYNWQDFANTCH